MFRFYFPVWILALPAALILWFGCDSKPIDNQVKSIPFSINRFEKALFGADPQQFDSLVPTWNTSFPDFLPHFSYVTQLGPVDDQAFPSRLRAFATHRSNYMLYKRVLSVFPDTAQMTAQLSEAFGRFAMLFPDKPVPRIVTYVSGLGQTAIGSDSLLALALDKYLGREEDIYRQAGLYQYLTQKMTPEKLVPDCMIFWGETCFPYTGGTDNLLSRMIYNGRSLYFATRLIPGISDTLVLGFSSGQLSFCLDNERSMWTRLIEGKRIFATDRFTMDKYLLDGPFTADFGRQSPGRAAEWIGYRIVCAYMEKNRKTSLPELMAITNYQEILNQSAYNP